VSSLLALPPPGDDARFSIACQDGNSAEKGDMAGGKGDGRAGIRDVGRVGRLTNSEHSAQRPAAPADYENRREIIRVVEIPHPNPLRQAQDTALPQGGDGVTEREVWTGNYIFENEWQSYRTRKSRTLELNSAEHDYPKHGRYKIAVKVIDIFGNDTTKVVEVKV
jgi:hypothetical protein